MHDVLVVIDQTELTQRRQIMVLIHVCTNSTNNTSSTRTSTFKVCGACQRVVRMVEWIATRCCVAVVVHACLTVLLHSIACSDLM